jgi:CheY-like chemotaxis protein
MARILVIDDDLENRFALEKVLKLHGHEVDLAANGADGVIKFRASPFDLVITDIYMPQQGGIETIVQLRKEFPDIRIIAMSGNDEVGASFAVAKHMGVCEVLHKPFSSDHLMKAVQNAL